MNWRFWEKRSGYTDTIINALIQAAEGSARNAHATAALESAAGLYQAAFSAAKVEPEQEALGPSFLGEAARRLIRYGETCYLIEVEDGKIRLRDVASWNIGGGPNEEDWTYSLERGIHFALLTTRCWGRRIFGRTERRPSGPPVG